MFCPSCGDEHQNKKAKFCSSCGTFLHHSKDKSLHEDIFDRQDEKDIRSANTLAWVSVIFSIIIPIIGVILAIVSLVRIDRTSETSQNRKMRTHTKNNAAGAILIALLMMFFWGWFFYNQQSNAVTEQEQQATTQQELLDTCLDDAEDDYWSYVELNGKLKETKKNGDKVYTAPQEVWDKAEKNKQQNIDNCYRRHK